MTIRLMWPTEVCCEEHPGSMHESDCRQGFLIDQGLGVCERKNPSTAECKYT